VKDQLADHINLFHCSEI